MPPNENSPTRPASGPASVPGGALDLSAAFESALAALEKFDKIDPAADQIAAQDAKASGVLPAAAVAAPDPNLLAELAQLKQELAVARSEADQARTEAAEVRRSLGRAHAEAAHAQADVASIRRMIARAEADLPVQTARRLLEGMLPALDHLTSVAEYLMLHETLTEHGRQAIEMLLAEWRRAMVKIQLEPFDALGLPFDPQRHEIIARVSDPMHPDATVLRQAARGYLYAGRLLRSAQVVVNSAAARNSEPVPDFAAD